METQQTSFLNEDLAIKWEITKIMLLETNYSLYL